MISIDINNKMYNCPVAWSEITLKQGIELSKIVNNFPAIFKEIIYRSLLSDDKLKELEPISVSNEMQIKVLPTIYGQIISLLCDIPDDVMKFVTWKERTVFYNKLLHQFVVGVLYMPHSNEIKDITDFTINDKVYYLPVSEERRVAGMDITIPMAEISALQFTESVDLELSFRDLAGGKFNVAANIISILCLPKGEAYDEKQSLSRVRLFEENLTMDVVWSVFFCSIKWLHIRKAHTPYSLKVTATAKV